MRAIDRFNRFGTEVYNGQDQLKNHIFDHYPVVHTEEEISDWQNSSEYVWLVDSNIKVYDSFPWYFKPNPDEEKSIHAFPYVYKESREVKSWEMVRLVPTATGNYSTKKYKYICGDYDVYQGKDSFDIFYVSDDPRDYFSELQKRFPNIIYVNSIKKAKELTQTDMFWVIPGDVIVRDTFKFSYKPDEWSHDYVHVFGNGDIDQLDGVILYPKNYDATEKELEYRFFKDKKEVRIMASTPRQYDKFEINNYEQYQHALKYSSTDMFWGIPQDIEVTDESVFDLYISHHSKDTEKNHVWLNGNKYDGVVLFSKHAPVTEKEIKHRFVVNRIEHNQIVSCNKTFDRFVVDNYEDYLEAKKHSTTSMFWMIPSDVVQSEEFAWDGYFENQDALDRTTTHVFLNGEHTDGIVLTSVNSKLTQKEVDNRFYIDKKEHNVIASTPFPYERFEINNYEQYTEALYNSKYQMFWGVPSDVEITNDKLFDTYFSHHNKYDRTINHVFLNGENYDGVVLFSKDCLVSEKEVDHRFYVKKKEWDAVISKPKKFDVFRIDSYAEYESAKENSTTDMFYLVYSDIDVLDTFKFDHYISHHNQYERKINHVWKNGEYYDGIVLTSKHIHLTPREIDFRFMAIKKEYDEIASMPKKYEVVFISNGEQNADDNYEKLLEKVDAWRVDRVKGIHQAHIAAAEKVSTEMFWVVDGDAEVLDDFEFDYQIAHYDIDGRNTVHVWRSFNPINGLVYGYGGVKLLPTELTRNVDIDAPDMTTSISNKFKGINRMSNTTAFNTDAFSAWRSGFRECVKLASRAIDRQNDEETEFRLNAWCDRGADKPFGEYAIAGAKLGRKYGEIYKDNKEALAKINNFEWLREQFNLSSSQ